MCGLLVKNLLAGFRRADHVPVVPAQPDLVDFAILTRPGGDLLVWLAAELVGISEDGKTGWAGSVLGARWWTALEACVEDEDREEEEE